MKLLLLRLVLCKFKQKEQMYNASINVKLLKNSQDKTVFILLDMLKISTDFET